MHGKGQVLHLSKVCAFIGENIDDPQLPPKQMARVLSILVRYPHWVFAAIGKSVDRYVLQRRQEGCAARPWRNLALAVEIWRLCNCCENSIHRPGRKVFKLAACPVRMCAQLDAVKYRFELRCPYATAKWRVVHQGLFHHEPI